MKVSPTAKSLALLTKQGYLPWIVERRIPRARITRDLFGVIDIVAIPAQSAFLRVGLYPTLAIQTTTSGNMASRVTKVREATYNFGTEEKPDERLILPMLNQAGWRVQVHGWVKRPNGRWQCRIWDMTEDMEITDSVHA